MRRRVNAVLMAGIATAAWIAPQAASAQSGEPMEAKPVSTAQEDGRTIVVIGDRAIIASLKDTPVEQTLDADAVESYGVSTVGEVIDQMRGENGDDEPALLVNGRPVANPSDISDLPAEAVARIEVLPKGSAAQINGAAGQRAYNVVLHSSLKSATLTASREEATQGGWSNTRGEALFTYIKGQDRFNLTVRGAKSTDLLESERDFVPRTESIAYSPGGNILLASGSQVDPLLSALAGRTVTIVALPQGVTRPTLAGLVPFANQTNPSTQSAYRTLRGASRPIDVGISGNKVLASWLSLSFNGRLGWTRNENLSGLPSARFLIPQTNANTPFSVPVFIAINDPGRPLRSASQGSNQSFSATLNAILGTWSAQVTTRWDRRENDYSSQFTGVLGSLATVGASTNPFDGSLAGLIPVSLRESSSTYATRELRADLQGPVVDLWAGPLLARASLGAIWSSYDASDTAGRREVDRHEYSARAGLTIPLTSKQHGALAALGDSAFELDIGAIDLGRFGTLERRSFGFNWQPTPWLRFNANDVHDERAIPVELLAAPEVATPNVAYFDPLTGQTVDVTTIYGGASGLTGETSHTRTFGATLSPLKKYAMQLSVEYAKIDLRNQIGALPLPSSAVVAAFPDRFVRDAGGTLILVDNRSVNFARQDSDQLRFGLRFAIPLTSVPAIPPRDASGKRIRKPVVKLDVTLNHTVTLKNAAVIRTGLPEVDLLAGGAIGIGGGQPRHSTRAGLALTRGATGLRFDYTRRGGSELVIGSLASPDLLRFSALSTLDVKLLADLQQLFPRTRAARGTRLSLVFDNVTNNRQAVTNLAGITPQAYQPLRRDPLGRTVMLELRKVF